MGDISKHTSIYEARCKCHFCTVTQQEPVINMHLVTLLELILAYCEERFGSRVMVNINSWNRCEKHNRAVGGKADSRHLTPKHADAMDIVVSYPNEHGQWQQIPPDHVGDIVDEYFPDHYGVGVYLDKGFTHIDARPGEPWRKGFFK